MIEYELAKEVAREDFRQICRVGWWLFPADPAQRRKYVSSQLARLLRDLGYVRVRLEGGRRKWMREGKALRLLVGLPMETSEAIGCGYRHVCGVRKHLAAMKISPEKRHERAKRAAAASVESRRRRRQ